MATIVNNEIERKPARYTLDCTEMLNEAITYYANKSPKRAELIGNKFFEIIDLLELMPEIGTICQNGMRKMLLGKFPYFIYYRIKTDYISIVGIWHTSRGTDFVEPVET
jgi:plasmid stabilization system protein ParE